MSRRGDNNAWTPERLGAKFHSGKFHPESAKHQSPENILMNPSQAAEYLGVTRQAVWEYCKKGMLRHQRVGAGQRKNFVFSLAGLDDFIIRCLIPRHNAWLAERIKKAQDLANAVAAASRMVTIAEPEACPIPLTPATPQKPGAASIAVSFTQSERHVNASAPGE